MIRIYNIHNVYRFQGQTAKSALIVHMAMGYSFCNLDLRGFDLSDTDWANRRFIRSNLTGTNFRYCNLLGADFSMCRMEHTDFTGAQIDDRLRKQLSKWSSAIIKPIDGNQLLLFPDGR